MRPTRHRADFRHGACFQPSSAPAPLRHHSRERFGPLQLTPAGARFSARRAALRIYHWCKFLSQGSHKSQSRGPPSSSLPSLLRCVDHCATQPSGPRACAGRGRASALSNRGRRAVGGASRGVGVIPSNNHRSPLFYRMVGNCGRDRRQLPGNYPANAQQPPAPVDNIGASEDGAPGARPAAVWRPLLTLGALPVCLEAE